MLEIGYTLPLLQSNARKGGLLCLAATAVALATPGIGGARPPDLLQVSEPDQMQQVVQLR